MVIVHQNYCHIYNIAYCDDCYRINIYIYIHDK